MSAIRKVFAACASHNRPAFVAFVTSGFPTPRETPDIMLALEKGGADIIELGIPFTDPLADGPAIQHASEVALRQNVHIPECLSMVSQARSRGLKAPVVFMGYYNPLLNYGEEKIVEDCAAAGVDGFIVVDLPPEEAVKFRNVCASKGLSYVPLIAPSTSESRIAHLASISDSFIYVVSKLGVTGTSDTVNTDLPNLISRIRLYTDTPLAVGFGVGTREQFEQVGEHADGVVIGSRLITILRDAESGKGAEAVREFAAKVSGRSACRKTTRAASPRRVQTETPTTTLHTLADRFGEFGGQYLPEALVEAHAELEKVFTECKDDPAFWDEFRSHYDFIGRPSRLQFAERLTKEAGGARIWLKREDLNHTGSHKINNALGQILLAKRLNKRRIIAETGAGQHGVATATVCAKFGYDCVIYMGAEDVRRQALNVFRIRMLGATVVPVHSGSKTLKDAINEAMRDWVTNVQTTHYLVGSAIGPHPFPTLVREFQSVIGKESLSQFREQTKKNLPSAVVACVGGGSNAIGLFHEYIQHPSVRIVGVEAAGDGLDTDRHSATLSKGRPGVFHGTRTYLLQDSMGQICETHSISAVCYASLRIEKETSLCDLGFEVMVKHDRLFIDSFSFGPRYFLQGLDYPGVGPEHAWLKDSGRAEYVSATDSDAMEGFRKLTQLEGIIPALETAHAIHGALKLASGMGPDEDVIVCISGRGDKDVQTIAERLPELGPKIGWDLRFE